MRSGYIFILCYVVMFAVLPGACAEVAGLGESLLLEGRLALLRGETWVLSQQHPDGSWQNDSALTSQAGMLLANSDAEYFAEHLHRAVCWIHDHAKQLNSAGQYAQALRLPLRLNHPQLADLVKYFQEQKSSWNWQEESVVSCQWLLEAHFLLPQKLALLTMVEVQQLQQNFLREKRKYPALALLTLLSSGTLQIQTTEQEVLLSACVAQTANASPENAAVIVAGSLDRGRYTGCGLGLGIGRGEVAAPLSESEQKLLLNVIYWLGQKKQPEQVKVP